MKKGTTICAVVISVVLIPTGVLANGLNLNSLGSRALAMGGAFVGLADDYSAIYWNPAGIAQFQKRYTGFYGADIIPSGSYTSDPAVVSAETERKSYLVGLGAYYVPLTENVVAGLGLYIPSGLGSQWDGTDFAPVTFSTPYRWESRIGMVTIAPALAYKASEKVYVGAALNVNYATFDINTHAGDQKLGVDLGQYEESLNGWGLGATFGVLVKPHEMISLGAALRTKAKISFSGDVSVNRLMVLSQIPGTPLFGTTIPTTTAAERDITWPWWAAGGVAVKPQENLTLTADLQWTQWSQIDVMETDFDEPVWALVVGTETQMQWKDTLQIRMGAEYRVDDLAFRGGYYWDPTPAPDRTMNVLLPNYDFHVITVGFGYGLDGLQVDLGFEYLLGQERNIPSAKTNPSSPQFDPDWETAMPGTYDMNILVPNVSVSYTF